MRAVTFAAITLADEGGGVAAASRLMWSTIGERWATNARLVTLLPDRPVRASLDSSTAARLRFGARLAKAQILNDSCWTFYAHLSVAQVQQYIPAAFRRPYGVFLHGIEVWRPLTPAQRRLINGAEIRIANSAYTVERIRQQHPWIGPVVPCPLALPHTRPASMRRAPSGQNLGPHVVLLVGRMASGERYKGHDELLDAWPAVVARVPDARLVFAGTGDDASRLRDRAARAGLGGSVVFPGFVSEHELFALYESAALFAMPSRNEGFGLVYLEAMAHGLPCLGSDEDAARDLIQDGVTGFLVPQSDVAALADRIVRLLTDDALRGRMGERGRERLDERFSYPRFRDRFGELLANAFGEAPAVRMTGVSRAAGA